MGSKTVRGAGMVWYRSGDYSRILEIMSDADKLSPTFEQWRVSAERGEREMKSKGFLIVRAMIDPEEFATRCAARGIHPDAKARTEFAAEFAQQHFGKTH
jgi:hypothetical protein